MTRLALVLLLVLLASEVGAEGARKKVVVVTPSAEQGKSGSIAQRLQAELTASGFEVQFKRFSWQSLRAMVDAAAVDPDAAATVTIASGQDSRSEGGLSVDVWIADRLGGKTVGRRVDGGSPEQLSVRVVEALRAGLMEVNAAPEPEPEPDIELDSLDPPLPPPEPDPPLQPLREERWRVSSGAALLVGGESLSAAVGPQFRASTNVGPGFWLGVQVLAPLWGAEEQDASVSQAMFKGELTWLVPFATGMRLSPTVGAGWYWLGRGREGAIRPDSDHAVVASLGVGIGLDITDTTYVLWDVQSMVFFPQPGVIVPNRGEARPGLPGFLSSLGLNMHF